MVSLAKIFKGKTARTIPWGPWQLPFEQREDHFLFMGTSGSGKTVSLGMQYAAILPYITPESSERALIYDKKGDTLQNLHRLKARGLIKDIPIYLFNPTDARSHAWDVMADVNTFAHNQLDLNFHRIVHNLFPPGNSSGEHSAFFRNKLIELAKLVLHGFAAAQIKWTLRDFLAVLYDQDQRNKVIALHPNGQLALKKCGDAEVYQNIEASVAADLTPFGELASLMQLAADKGDNCSFSINKWLSEPSILVLSGTTDPDVPLARLNRTFLAELIESLTRRKDTRTDITWVFLDEAASLGRQERFPTLMRECRSKGASVFLGIQDIQGFRAALGNDKEADSILAQIKNLGFFKLPDAETAEWASLRCGETRRIDPMQGHIRIERRFSFSDFQDQFKFRPNFGLPGIFRTSDRLPTKATLNPLLLDKAENEWQPLGDVPWPSDARPSVNSALAKLLGSPHAFPPRALNGKLPTTGRVLPPKN